MDYLQSMPFYYYLAAGSGCVAVLAIILYFVPGGKIRIPAIAFSGLACFMAGIGVGVIGMSYFGFHWEHEPTPPIARSPFGGGGGPPDGGASKKGGEGNAKKGGEGAAKKGDDKKGNGKKEEKADSADAKKSSEKKSKVEDF